MIDAYETKLGPTEAGTHASHRINPALTWSIIHPNRVFFCRSINAGLPSYSHLRCRIKTATRDTTFVVSFSLVALRLFRSG